MLLGDGPSRRACAETFPQVEKKHSTVLLTFKALTFATNAPTHAPGLMPRMSSLTVANYRRHISHPTGQRANRSFDSDYSTTSADIGLRYTFSSGSSLTCTTTTASGAYLNRALSAAGFYDDSFSQIDNELRLHWAVTGNSTANLRLTHINRSHPHFDQRDYNGLNSALDLNWSLTGKTALTAAWTRELASYQTNDYNYSQTNRLMVGPVWQVGAKLILRMRHEIAQRSFLGTPTGIIGPCAKTPPRNQPVRPMAALQILYLGHIPAKR